MSDISEFLTEVSAGIKEHLRLYIETDGKEGYYKDMSHHPEGGDPKSITLVLRTIGRKTGRTLLAPLLYNHWKDEFVIVASKGGGDENPGWFYNVTAADMVDVQVKNRRYRCAWRIAAGAERARIWSFMVDYYPPYRTYQARTKREIPVLILTPVEELQEKFVLGSALGVDVRTDKQKS